MINKTWIDEFDNAKCAFNDNVYCTQIGICENCEHYPEKYKDKLISLQDVQSTGQNEQLSMFKEVKYDKKRRRKSK